MTQQMIEKVRSYLSEIDQMGGVIKAIEEGWIVNTIHMLATQKQAKIDSGTDLIVGVNHLRQDTESAVANNYRNIDGHRVREEQTNFVNTLNQHRNDQEVNTCLARLTDAAKDTSANLLEVTIEAIRARATIGECIEALGRVWHRTKMPASYATDYYANKRRDELDWQRVKRRLNLYSLNYQQPKILIAKLGLDGHDRGAKVVAAGLADLGFDVTMTPLFQKPEDLISYLNKTSYDILGVSILSGAHLTLIESLCEMLKSGDIIKVVGGVIPDDHHEKLRNMGIDDVFTPGAKIDEIANKLIDLLTRKDINTEQHHAL
jgi:methylmalonyl-CoA mutase